MYELEQIKQLYNKVIEAKGKTGSEGEITLGFALSKQLLASNELDVLNFQYECLRDMRSYTAYTTCRAAFGKRKNIEHFLLQKLSIESDTHVRADIVHILGIIRSNKALGIAKEYLVSDNEYMREVCLYVIGWTGSFDEIDLLLQHLLTETTEKLKTTAGSAMRQIAWKDKETKEYILKALKIAFETEQNRNVLSRIIELMGSVAVKNLGMREAKDDPYILLGDLDKAIIKTKKFVQTL